MPTRNPFGDDARLPGQRVNPFGDEDEPGTLEEGIGRIEHAARAVRRLKSQLGAEGLTLSATRELIDELSLALEAAARGLRELSRRND
jgi:hypothetical protein